MYIKIDEVFYNIKYIRCVKNCAASRGSVRVYFDGLPDIYTDQFKTAAELIRRIAKIHKNGEGDTQ